LQPDNGDRSAVHGAGFQIEKKAIFETKRCAGELRWLNEGSGSAIGAGVGRKQKKSESNRKVGSMVSMCEGRARKSAAAPAGLDHFASEIGNDLTSIIEK
jgi:hypothetical protein